jgi:hypothetical protein
VPLRSETPFHADPGGTALGTLRAGVPVTPGRTSGSWREATFEAWIWSASTGRAVRPGYSLQVTAADGENLRNGRDADLVGRAVQGTQFNQVARDGGWIRVRRTAWVPASTIRTETARAAPPARRPEPAATPAVTPVQPSAPAPPPADTLARVIVRKGAALATGPGGAALGSAPADLPGRVTARSGNWIRVETSAWVREEEVTPAADSGGVTLDRLRTEGDKLTGQPVQWRLQFLSVQTADELRPELPAGQPYVLARGPLPEAGFVYVVVSREQAERFRAMEPLEEFRANGVIRATRTRYLATPVIELRGQP